MPDRDALDRETLAAAIDAGGRPWPTPFPPRQRPEARFGLLDVTKYFGPTTGGVRTYLLQKAAYVAAHPELRQTIAIPGERDGLIDGDGVRCYRLRGARIPTQHPYRFLWAPRTMRRILEHERPDLIEVGSPFLVPWTTHHVNRGLGVPMVWFYHGNVPHLVAPQPERSGGRRAAHAAAWAYVRRVSRLFRAVLVASDFVAEELARHGVDNALRVPLGVDVDLFHPTRAAARAATRARHGLDPDAPLAVFAGRFAREKRLEVLLRAWPAVARRTGAQLALIGDGPSRRWFQAQPGASQVHWLPFATDRAALADLLAAADLYVAAGPNETFGLAALEAMASGLPVLSVDRGGVPEQVRQSGAGDLYPDGDAAALAETAVALLGRDLAALGLRARAHAERHHAWPLALERIFDAYRRVAGQG
ncbi:MAG TPA: glycosyltransferase [Gemmatimonadales bacterium]|nr:glycosyltransferase [Gemmatimonadales bacterium]